MRRGQQASGRRRADTEAPPGQGQAGPLPPEATARGYMGRVSGPLFHEVETTAGWIQGLGNGHIRQFKGVSYGVSTAGCAGGGA